MSHSRGHYSLFSQPLREIRKIPGSALWSPSCLTRCCLATKTTGILRPRNYISRWRRPAHVRMSSIHWINIVTERTSSFLAVELLAGDWAHVYVSFKWNTVCYFPCKKKHNVITIADFSLLSYWPYPHHPLQFMERTTSWVLCLT